MTKVAEEKERVFQFGDKLGLIGIVTVPQKINLQNPALIIINSGALHRVGACRSAVIMARSLAKKGILTLRFDLHGLGDSSFGGQLTSEPLFPKIEISQAMDALFDEFNINHFVLHGLCSGAQDAFNSAINDNRVVGLSMIDGHAYRDFRFHYLKLISFLKSPKRWPNAVKIRLQKQRPKALNTASDPELYQVTLWPGYPPKKLVAQGFQKLVNRKVKILVTYTGTWQPEYNYENQFTRMYSQVNFNDLAIINYMPNASHTMPIKEDRDKVTNKLIEMFKAFSIN